MSIESFLNQSITYTIWELLVLAIGVGIISSITGFILETIRKRLKK